MSLIDFNSLILPLTQTAGTLVPVVGFGTDTSCTDSMKTGQLVTGVTLVGQSYYRRLTTPRGTLQGGEAEADFGLDLQDLVGSVTTKSDAAALEGKIVAELMKDERSQTVTADVVETTSTAGLSSFLITVNATTAFGPFTVTVAVSSVTIELLGIVPTGST